jgi:hypothetical protein
VEGDGVVQVVGVLRPLVAAVDERALGPMLTFENVFDGKMAILTRTAAICEEYNLGYKEKRTFFGENCLSNNDPSNGLDELVCIFGLKLYEPKF